MNMNAGKSEDHHREKVPDQDLYDSYSGGAFSFPTTPSCNEDEIEEQQEDPQLNWPVQVSLHPEFGIHLKQERPNSKSPAFFFLVNDII